MSLSVSIGYAFSIACVVSLATTPVVRAAAHRWGLLDHPSPRSSHRTATPRGGGIAVALGLAAALMTALPLWQQRTDAMAFVAGAALVASVGLLDDRMGLPPLVRLAAQVAAAGVLVAVAGPLERLPLPAPLDVPLGHAGAPLAILWIVAVVNFYNFMDGIDGLAGIQALITGGALALSGADPLCGVLGAALAGGCAGFLPFNWAPARIFLGDVGSGLLGYTLSAIPFLAPPETRDRVVLLVGTSLWLFLADATACLLRRVARGRRWYEAHREHLYQRWANAGAGHARVTAWIAVGSAVATLTALLAWRDGPASLAWAALALGTTFFALERQVVRRLERRASTE